MLSFVKRAVCLTLCLIMTLCLCACGNGGEKSDHYCVYCGKTPTLKYENDNNATYFCEDCRKTCYYCRTKDEPVETAAKKWILDGTVVFMCKDCYEETKLLNDILEEYWAENPGDKVGYEYIMGLVEERRNESGGSSKKSFDLSFLQKILPTRLRGTYKENGGDSVLALGTNMMFLENEYGVFKGGYSVDGDKLRFTYTSGVEMYETEPDTLTYRFSRSGKDLTLRYGDSETVYVKQSGSFDIMQYLPLAGAAVCAIVLLFVLRAVIRRLRRRVRRTQGHTQTRAAGRAARTVAASAKDVSAGVAAGVSAGIAAGKAAHQQRRQERVQMIPVSRCSCCICGGSLGEGATSLTGLASGREAWIDNACLARLQAMAQGNSYEEFERAARYMHRQSVYIDPEVGRSLGRFVKKCSVRFIPLQQEAFQL